MNTAYRSIGVGVMALLLVGGAFGVGVYAAVRSTSAHLPAAATDGGQKAPAFLLDASVLEAKAAVLYDVHTGAVLYQKNATEALPLASLTKLMAAQTVLSLNNPATLVVITAEDLRPEGDSGLKPGETMALGDLIKLALVASSNDAITAAAASLGDDPIAKMNTAARELGLTKTLFYNATGLDITERVSGAYGSAYDVARLASLFYIDHADFFELTTLPKIQVDGGNKEISLAATALPLQDIPGFVAAKTGYTTLAGGNLVAIFDLQPGTTVAAVVLGSTHEGRFSDIKTIIEAARASL
ncbi:D-alanyl-D-alanine carboxypeptidase [Candidatus Kaiserbacteria bacterium]|nr:D-alanyl-D-alanine carboxypeptidase [Candidatus Kaiserbacteria bacterium]